LRGVLGLAQGVVLRSSRARAVGAHRVGRRSARLAPPMPYFDSFDGITLHYSDEGAGRPVVLLHGMGADATANFEQTGIRRVLRDAALRVVTPDIRGHGESETISEPERFADDAMRRDVSALLDHLDVDEAVVVGYSMSAFTTLRLAAHDPRVVAIVLIGIGE